MGGRRKEAFFDTRLRECLAFASSGYGACLPDSPQVNRGTFVCSECSAGPRVFLSVLQGTRMSQTFLNGSTFLSSSPTRKWASAKTALSESAPTTTGALLLFHEVGDVDECISDGRPRCGDAVKDGLSH